MSLGNSFANHGRNKVGPIRLAHLKKIYENAKVVTVTADDAKALSTYYLFKWMDMSLKRYEGMYIWREFLKAQRLETLSVEKYAALLLNNRKRHLQDWARNHLLSEVNKTELAAFESGTGLEAVNEEVMKYATWSKEYSTKLLQKFKATPSKIDKAFQNDIKFLKNRPGWLKHRERLIAWFNKHTLI